MILVGKIWFSSVKVTETQNVSEKFWIKTISAPRANECMWRESFKVDDSQIYRLRGTWLLNAELSMNRIWIRMYISRVFIERCITLYIESLFSHGHVMNIHICEPHLTNSPGINYSLKYSKVCRQSIYTHQLNIVVWSWLED